MSMLPSGSVQLRYGSLQRVTVTFSPAGIVQLVQLAARDRAKGYFEKNMPSGKIEWDFDDDLSDPGCNVTVVFDVLELENKAMEA